MAGINAFKKAKNIFFILFYHKLLLGVHPLLVKTIV